MDSSSSLLIRDEPDVVSAEVFVSRVETRLKLDHRPDLDLTPFFRDLKLIGKTFTKL